MRPSPTLWRRETLRWMLALGGVALGALIAAGTLLRHLGPDGLHVLQAFGAYGAGALLPPAIALLAYAGLRIAKALERQAAAVETLATRAQAPDLEAARERLESGLAALAALLDAVDDLVVEPQGLAHAARLARDQAEGDAEAPFRAVLSAWRRLGVDLMAEAPVLGVVFEDRKAALRQIAAFEAARQALIRDLADLGAPGLARRLEIDPVGGVARLLKRIAP